MRRLVFVAAAVAATALAAAAGADTPVVATSAPAWSPDGSKLAYVLETPARSDVLVRTIATGATTNLTADEPQPGNDLPAWSRDGTRLAYVTAVGDFQQPRFLYSVVAADGTGRHVAGTSGAIGRPCFSASGARIAFDDFEQVDSASTSGGAQRTLAVPAGFPVCSPHSDRVALTREAKNNLDVYTVAAGGGKKQRLTTAKGPDAPVAWSRDGSRILFETQREIVGKKPAKGRDVALYLMDANGRHQHRVVYGRFGDLAPDGKRLVYVTPRGAVVVAGLDGRHAHVLAIHGYDPKWSPSGRWIAFVVRVAEPGGGAPVVERIQLAHPDGSARHTLAL